VRLEVILQLVGEIQFAHGESLTLEEKQLRAVLNRRA
jgi:hypothetical protein